MKIALITTTIQVPRVLFLYGTYARTLPDGFQMFVAGDLKTPNLGEGPWVYLSPEQQQEDWKTSRLLPWNSITRRNIALLEALKWGADVIVTVDDDNIPVNPDYFDYIQLALEHPFSGLRAASPSGWFDVGQLVFPSASHRGFPAEKIAPPALNPVVGAAVGVCAGIVLGDPDISAVTRIATHPTVHVTSEVLRSGVVVDPSAVTVFNTQNTAVLRKFAPALLCCPQLGRFDDIYASLVAQRVMRDESYCVHFGQPFVYQQRNNHNLIQDLKDEVFGMEHILQFAEVLDHILVFERQSHPVRQIYETIRHIEWMPDGVYELAMAWMDDVEAIL
jgi:hypothetical protein